VASINEQSGKQQADFARQVLQAEADAIGRIEIGEGFSQAVDLVLAATTEPTRGRVVVGGVGKSGLIGRKISATLSSTGTPSFFMYPTEAMHGDLGQLSKDDVALLLSFGGSTEEVVALAALLSQDNVPVISIVGKAECHLGQLSTAALAIGDVTEACPLNLAPTASTTAMLAMGDALALCVSKTRNFGVDDFQRVHPGGALGKQLMPITSAMRWTVGENLATFEGTITIGDAFSQADQHAGRRPGALMVIDDNGKLAGIFTDGDIRRLLIKHQGEALNLKLGDVMTKSPRRLTTQALVREAVQLVREFRIDEIPIVDENDQPVGLIDVQDLVALKVIEG
jgi:arabinose-5-phosphate isomerase